MIKNNVVVYTAISGLYDHLRMPTSVNDNFDYVFFTDDEDLESELWIPLPFDQYFEDKTLMARYVKLLPHRYFSEYEYSIWIDGNIVINQDIEPLLELFLRECDIAMFKHPEHRTSVYDEVDACIALEKELKHKLTFQRDLYYSLGYVDRHEVIPATYVIFRRHNQRASIMAMEEWWMHVLTYGKRDQVSFPFIAWKQDLPFSLIGHQDFLSYFAQFPHVHTEQNKILSLLSQGGLFQVDNENGRLTIIRKQPPQINKAKVLQDILSKIVLSDGRFQILYGPFEGLIYPEASSVGSALVPKLLGTYESELHTTWEKICEIGYETIINIGAGEGYYANGLLKRIGNAFMIAFETDPHGRKLCEEVAYHNHLEQRLIIYGECNLDCFAQVVNERKHGLIVCDCEGYEVELLDPGIIERLKDFDLLVELHDSQSIGPTVMQLFYTRFASTHTLEFINVRPLKSLLHLDFLGIDHHQLQAVVLEGRVYSVGWVFLQAKR